MRNAAAVVGAALLLLAGCTPAAPEPTPTPEPQPVIATFEVAGGETYRIELATPELIEHAKQLLDGEPVAAIPVGTVVRDDPGPNAPWSWHIDPSTLEFAEVTIEVCDGLPSYVEDGTVTSDVFCPWSATVVDVSGG